MHFDDLFLNYIPLRYYNYSIFPNVFRVISHEIESQLVMKTNDFSILLVLMGFPNVQKKSPKSKDNGGFKSIVLRYNT